MRSSLGLLVVMLLAAGVGVIAAHSQSQTVAAPGATPTPFALPSPPAGAVYIVGGGTGPSRAQYDPATQTVHVGQKVTWTNQDSQAHTVTADNGAFNSDVLNPGKSYSWTPKKAGQYSYSDYTASDLQGTLVVQP